MGYKIKFTFTAEQDLREIGFYVLDESKNLDTALNHAAKLRSSVKNLDKFPESGSNPRDRFLVNLGYKFIPEGDYLTFYKIDKNAKIIYIAAVLNGKTDYVKILKKRL